jgi:hypothetical protein
VLKLSEVTEAKSSAACNLLSTGSTLRVQGLLGIRAESARFYPHQAKASQLLYEPNRVVASQINQASTSATGTATK